MKPSHEHVFYENSAISSLYLEIQSFDFTWHYHDDYEISLCLKGAGLRYTGDAIDSFSAPELILIPPMLPHTWQSHSTGDHVAYIIQFKKDFLGTDLRRIKDLESTAALLEEPRSQKLTPDDRLISIVENIHKSTGAERLSMLLLLLDRIDAHSKSFGNEHSPEVIDRTLGKKFDAAATHLSQNWNQDIKVPHLARLCGMSESTFRRFFKRTTGRSFVDYLNLIRITRACEFLVDDLLTVLQISDRCGFNSLSFFNRKFKEIKGVSPSKFRQLHQEALTRKHGS